MKRYDGIPTPSIVVDMAIVRDNIRRMQAATDRAGCKLRPHIKTHKTPFFARMQVEAGACGITCAKLGEAEAMADAGISDIFIAYPLVDEIRIQKAIALHRRAKRLIVAADSLEGAARLSHAAVAAGVELEARLEVDTGAARTGLPMERVVETFPALLALPGLRFTGIYTFKSLMLHRAPTTDAAAAAEEEGTMLAGLRAALAQAGYTSLEISAGSTPTGALVAATGCVDEIRPGTYIFGDAMMVAEGVMTPAQTAAQVIVTVVSCPRPDYAVIDGGIKCFSTDPLLHIAPYHYSGYAAVRGNDDLLLDRMSEEHGILRSKRGDTGLRVGQRLALLPVHICTTVNLHNELILDWGDRLEALPIAARGMLV